MILSPLRNALSLTATIYQYRNETVVKIQQIPGRPGFTTTGCIHLKSEWQGSRCSLQRSIKTQKVRPSQ